MQGTLRRATVGLKRPVLMSAAAAGAGLMGVHFVVSRRARRCAAALAGSAVLAATGTTLVASLSALLFKAFVEASSARRALWAQRCTRLMRSMEQTLRNLPSIAAVALAVVLTKRRII
jgi:hypothetical protein